MKTEQPNPASTVETSRASRKRIPMSVPQQKLQVPDIPGYHPYWFRGTPERILQAQNAWYEFVDPNEVNLNNIDLAGDGAKSGNTDLGSRVSIVAGGETGDGGQPVRLYLMKQKLEYYEEDQKISAARNAGVAEALTSAFKSGTVGGKAEGETSEDMSNRYVDTKRARVPDLFRPKTTRQRG